MIPLGLYIIFNMTIIKNFKKISIFFMGAFERLAIEFFLSIFVLFLFTQKNIFNKNLIFVVSFLFTK